MFKKYKFEEKFSYEYLYPTTHDAVLSILRKKKITNIRLLSKRKSSINIKIDFLDDERYGPRFDLNSFNQKQRPDTV